MKRILMIIAALFFTTVVYGQLELLWLGGALGHESEWHNANNWSNGDVPDEDSKVIIKYRNSGHNSQPVISTTVQVASIELHSMASLTIAETGSLVVDGENSYSAGISLFGGQVNNKGIIYLQNLSVEMSSEVIAAIQGMGLVYLGRHTF